MLAKTWNPVTCISIGAELGSVCTHFLVKFPLSEPKSCCDYFVHPLPKWASLLPTMRMRRQEIGLWDDLCSPMMNKPSLANTLMWGQIVDSLALVMTTSQCIAALIACFVLCEAPEWKMIARHPFHELGTIALILTVFSPPPLQLSITVWGRSIFCGLAD